MSLGKLLLSVGLGSGGEFTDPEGNAGKREAFKQKFLIACSARFWITPCGSRLVR